MKLLFCKNCEDIIRLIPNRERFCQCGATSGLYRSDGYHADYIGEQAVPLFIDNESLLEAIQNRPKGPGPGEVFVAGVVPSECKTFQRLE